MKIEKDWVTKSGLRAVIVRHQYGHLCGYVGVPENNPLFGKRYSEDLPCLRRTMDEALKGDIGKRGAIAVFCYDGKSANMEMAFNVHGGVTYTGNSEGRYPVDSGLWWIGFDCAHCDDTPEVCDIPYVIDECESLSLQIKEATK